MPGPCSNPFTFITWVNSHSGSMMQVLFAPPTHPHPPALLFLPQMKKSEAHNLSRVTQLRHDWSWIQLSLSDSGTPYLASLSLSDILIYPK